MDSVDPILGSVDPILGSVDPILGSVDPILDSVDPIMGSVDTTERALLERVESWRRQPIEAEEDIDLFQRRVEIEIERQMIDSIEMDLIIQEMEEEDRMREAQQRLQTRHNEPRLRSRTGHNEEENSTCVTCMDSLSDGDTCRASCGHNWCRTCVVNRFEAAARSTHLFPAQCCRRPILPDNNALIAPETWARYFEKKIEVETPNPTFCSKRDCSKFIPPQHIEKSQARCVCGHTTCTSCKAEWHSGECAVDPEVEQVLELAQEQKWQTCFHCKEMVDRRDGCNELRCRCGHTFCYACGKLWKTCPCPQFGRPESAEQPPARPTPAVGLRAAMDWFGELGREMTNMRRSQAPAAARRARQAAGAAPRAVEPVEPEATGATVEAAAVNDGAPAVATMTGRRVPPRVANARTQVMRQTYSEMLSGSARPTNPACDAHNWRRVGGRRTCQSCHIRMPNFIFWCRTCHRTSCRRCRQDADEDRSSQEPELPRRGIF